MRHNFRKSNFNRRAYRPLRQHNFADRGEGNNLVEKCEIINRLLFDGKEENYLKPEELIMFFEKCRGTWTCRATEGAVKACNHLINVLNYYTGKDKRHYPKSHAVYDPTELVRSSTKPLVLIGKEEPFDFHKMVEDTAEFEMECYFDSGYNSDKDAIKGWFEQDDLQMDGARDYGMEMTKDALSQKCGNLSLLSLVGNDALVEDEDPEDYQDCDEDTLCELFEKICDDILDGCFWDAFGEAFTVFEYELKDKWRYLYFDSEDREELIAEAVEYAKEHGLEGAAEDFIYDEFNGSIDELVDRMFTPDEVCRYYDCKLDDRENGPRSDYNSRDFAIYTVQKLMWKGLNEDKFGDNTTLEWAKWWRNEMPDSHTIWTIMTDEEAEELLTPEELRKYEDLKSNRKTRGKARSFLMDAVGKHVNIYKD